MKITECYGLPFVTIAIDVVVGFFIVYNNVQQ